MKTLAFILLLIVPSCLLSQKNMVFMELGGNGGLVSLNYERQLTPVPRLSLRAGVGMTVFDFEKEEDAIEPLPGCVLCGIDLGVPNVDLTIPVSVQYLFNLNPNNYLETGLGYTWQVPERSRADSSYDEKSIHVFHGTIGFRRYFGKSKKWMWKLNFTPLIGASGENIVKKSEPTIWGGIAIGKRF